MSSVSRRLVARARAQAFVAFINSELECERCGADTIEWHGEHHPEKPNARISSLVTQGCSVERIFQEMLICTPLCRRCHMAIDGRGAALHASGPYQKGQVYVPPLPCDRCGKPAKPLRKGMCYTCYERQRCGGRSHVHDRNCQL